MLLNIWPAFTRTTFNVCAFCMAGRTGSRLLLSPQPSVLLLCRTATKQRSPGVFARSWFSSAKMDSNEGGETFRKLNHYFILQQLLKVEIICSVVGCHILAIDQA